MNDQDFFDSVYAKLGKLSQERQEINENAKLALHFKRCFREVLFKKLETGMTVVILTTTDIFQEPCNYDIRQGLDDDIINDIAAMGYRYISKKSNQHNLFFEKANLQ